MILVLTLCAGLMCEEHRFPAPSLMACWLGQAEIAAQVRPGWRVERWRCEG